MAVGNYYINASNNTISVHNGLTYTPLSSHTYGTATTTFAAVNTQPLNYIAFNGDPNSGQLLKDQFRMIQENWEMPDHFFEADQLGVCLVCLETNIYRYQADQHVPVIEEEPDVDDWWDLLAG